MRNLPYLLVIAPHAPPKNTAEAIQVGRVLSALEGKAHGMVVSAEAAGGWVSNDETLLPADRAFTRHALRLPMHRLASRITGSSRLSWLHQPDSLFWLRFASGAVMRTLPQRPDAIYSRSGPLSGALLARTLKQQLQLPWIMHLSDPWADSPASRGTAGEHTQERRCFHEADAISLTCESQAAFYRRKYPEYASKLFLSPNMMPPATPPLAPPPAEAPLQLVYTGNLYGSRSPAPFVQALQCLVPAMLAQLRVDIYGHAQPDALDWLRQLPEVITYHGPVSYAQALEAQRGADMHLSLDPALVHPLEGCYLPSKVLESIALGKPVFAITSAHSETAALCREGYGWAVPTGDPQAIAGLLAQRIAERAAWRAAPPKAPPERFTPAAVAEGLLQRIAGLVESVIP